MKEKFSIVIFVFLFAFMVTFSLVSLNNETDKHPLPSKSQKMLLTNADAKYIPSASGDSNKSLNSTKKDTKSLNKKMVKKNKATATKNNKATSVKKTTKKNKSVSSKKTSKNNNKR